MTSREIALYAAIAVAVLIYVVGKIRNPSPPPPDGATDSTADQAKRSTGNAGPRGDVDHGLDEDDAYIPDEPPDVLYASRVGWYEDDIDPETGLKTGRTHVHWVPRRVWEDAQGDEPLPAWRRWLGL